MASERCPQCKIDLVTELGELIQEPFEGKLLQYGSAYFACAKCRITWYGSAQMKEQLQRRQNAL